MLFPFISDDKAPAPSTVRRTGPGTRAIAGGVLVTCAMLGVLVAPGGPEEADGRYLVAAVDLAPGEPLEPTMLQELSMSLPPTVARHAVVDIGDVEDLTTEVALPAGSVLHADQLTTAPAAAQQGPEVTVSVPLHRALGGDVTVGDHLDVITTYGSGTEGFSQVVAADVVVTDVRATADTLGVDPAVTASIRLARGADVLPVVHASHADALSLVVAGDGSPTGSEATYRPAPEEPR